MLTKCKFLRFEALLIKFNVKEFTLRFLVINNNSISNFSNKNYQSCINYFNVIFTFRFERIESICLWVTSPMDLEPQSTSPIAE